MISHTKKMWMWLRKGNLTRESESLLTAAQNNAIRTISKREQIRHNKTAGIVYVVIKTKRSIT